MQTEATATEKVASIVRAELARRRIPQARIADLLGISQVGVSRRLRGETPFDVDEIAAVAVFLGLSVAVLYGEQVAS